MPYEFTHQRLILLMRQGFENGIAAAVHGKTSTGTRITTESAKCQRRLEEVEIMCKKSISYKCAELALFLCLVSSFRDSY